MIETWIDALCAVWEMSDDRFGTVRSYRLVGESDFPASLDPADLDLHPVALTIPAWVKPEYSVGGPRIGFYTGVTQFHVCSDLSMARMPQMLPWYGKILRAAAANVKLNGTVEYFMLDDREDALAGPLALQFGSEALHWGFRVRWMVKEHLNDLTVSA